MNKLENIIYRCAVKDKELNISDSLNWKMIECIKRDYPTLGYNVIIKNTETNEEEKKFISVLDMLEYIIENGENLFTTHLIKDWI